MSNDHAKQNVEECPPPPQYYKLFSSNSHICPPVLKDSDLDIYNSIYNGVLPKNKEKTIQTVIDERRNYKETLKLQLDNILQKCLLLVTYRDAVAHNFDVERTSSDLRTSLLDIHQTMSEYRIHEARQLLCNDLQKQLDRLLEIASDLQICVNECGTNPF